MTTEPTTTPQAPAAWGDPQPPAPKWSGKHTAIAVAVAVLIAAIGAVAIYLGSSGSSSGQQGFGGPGGGRGFTGGQLGGMAAMRDALHGDFTVSDNGSYVTERMQTGEVTALSATSITVKSKDSYTQTYAIDSATEKADGLATGSEVLVLAKLSGNTATATTITDSNAASRGQGGFPGGPPGGQPGSN